MIVEEEEDISPANQSCDLIGDGSQPYALPTLDKTKYDRFKRIDGDTLVKLIQGHFKESVESYTIVDCRYPYEYAGGHIIDSLNIHTEMELVKLFLDEQTQQQNLQSRSQEISNTTTSVINQANNMTNDRPYRRIIIFHCEFSSERGPRLMKLLREKDRQKNQYPELNHPELYLLEGGYSKFYKDHTEYCFPQSYKPMRSKGHRDEMKSYRRRKVIYPDPTKENRSPDISFEG